jgi:hypothetical protein
LKIDLIFESDLTAPRQTKLWQHEFETSAKPALLYSGGL